MTLQDQIDLAEDVAERAHKRQRRRGGKPYITHPEAVAFNVPDECKPAAWLHDVLEDTDVSIEFLIEAGFESPTICALVCLKHEPWQSYEDYVLLCSKNTIARRVKMADIEHNLSDKPNPEKIEQYRKALKVLQKAETETKQAGSP